jgi:hypothetical protein
MARSNPSQLDSQIDEELAALLDAVEARPAQTSNGARAEAAADVEKVSETVSLNGRATAVRVDTPLAPRRSRRRRARSRLRRYFWRVARRSGVLGLYLLGVAIGLLVGWIIPTVIIPTLR